MNLKKAVLAALVSIFAFAVMAQTPGPPSNPPTKSGTAGAPEKRKVQDKDHDDKKGGDEDKDKDKDKDKDGKGDKDHKKKHDHKHKKDG
jgi:hypothetical protein